MAGDEEHGSYGDDSSIDEASTVVESTASTAGSLHLYSKWIMGKMQRSNQDAHSLYTDGGYSFTGTASTSKNYVSRLQTKQPRRRRISSRSEKSKDKIEMSKNYLLTTIVGIFFFVLLRDSGCLDHIVKILLHEFSQTGANQS